MNRRLRKEREGIVVSAKMDKTVVVKVNRSFLHSPLLKLITRGKKYYAHCEGFSVKEGQKVRILETRPLSKLKRWRVVEVLK